MVGPVGAPPIREDLLTHPNVAPNTWDMEIPARVFATYEPIGEPSPAARPFIGKRAEVVLCSAGKYNDDGKEHAILMSEDPGTPNAKPALLDTPVNSVKFDGDEKFFHHARMTKALLETIDHEHQVRGNVGRPEPHPWI